MSIYYILTAAGDIFELDSTEGIVYEDTGRLSKYKVDSDFLASDNYVNDNITLKLNGIISDIKSANADTDRTKSTDEFIRGIKKLKASKKTFTVIWREGNSPSESASDSVYRLANCMFTSFTLSQDSTNGYANGVYSYKVSTSFEQFRVGSQATVRTEKANFLVDKSSDKADSSEATEELTTGEGAIPTTQDYTTCVKSVLSSSYSVPYLATGVVLDCTLFRSKKNPQDVDTGIAP